SLAGSSAAIGAQIRQGSVGQLLASLPVNERAATALALRSSFAAGLNDLLYVTAGLALVGGVCSMLLIRRKDFVAREDAPGGVTKGRRLREAPPGRDQSRPGPPLNCPVIRPAGSGPGDEAELAEH